MADLDGSATTPGRGLRPLPEPSAVFLVIGGPIARPDIPAVCERVCGILKSSAAELVVCEVGGLVHPDAVAIDALARLQLTARRLGRRVRLHRAGDELKDLLAFFGLGDVLPCGAALPLEPRGQTEEREQALGVQEEADPGDPPL